MTWFRTVWMYSWKRKSWYWYPTSNLGIQEICIDVLKETSYLFEIHIDTIQCIQLVGQMGMLLSFVFVFASNPSNLILFLTNLKTSFLEDPISSRNRSKFSCCSIGAKVAVITTIVWSLLFFYRLFFVGLSACLSPPVIHYRGIAFRKTRENTHIQGLCPFKAKSFALATAALRSNKRLPVVTNKQK